MRESDPANVERKAVWLDRVTAADLMLIWPEEQGWPQYIGALVMLDGRALFGPQKARQVRIPWRDSALGSFQKVSEWTKGNHTARARKEGRRPGRDQ